MPGHWLTALAVFPVNDWLLERGLKRSTQVQPYTLRERIPATLL